MYPLIHTAKSGEWETVFYNALYSSVANRSSGVLESSIHTALGLRRRWERGRVRGSVKEVVADVSTSRFRPVRGLTNDTKPQKLRKKSGEIRDFPNRSLESLKKIRSVTVDMFDCADTKVFLHYWPRLI